jgi:AP-3 complex subunit mu
MDDVSFHPCVDYQRWQQGRVVSFVPPDGTFVLQKYRVSAHVPMPIYCKPQINFNDAGGRIFIMVGSKTASRRLDVRSASL